MSYDPEARRDTPLGLKLKERIRHDGPISVRDYMTACLYDDEHGYYRTRQAIGNAGDFITAPEISQIFGELIGLWCAVVWQQMGSPERFDLVELGPGRGTLMKDAVRATRGVPGFARAARIVLVETNRTLIEQQRRTLGDVPIAVEWLTFPPAAADCRASDVPVIVIANELLDCDPRDQLERTEHGWSLRQVAIDAADRLVFRLAAASAGLARSEFDPKALAFRSAPVGSVCEVTQLHWSSQLFERAPASAAIVLDYGHSSRGFGDTLQAVRLQRFEHPLTSPGEADLTMQVDFQTHCELFGGSPRRLHIDGPVTQAEFLGSIGIAERASRLMSANPVKAGEIEIGVARLMAPNGMGTRFKAIGIRSAHLPPLPGFPTLDASRGMR